MTKTEDKPQTKADVTAPAAKPVLRCRAIHQGIANRIMREPGDEFVLDDAQAFSRRWMEPIGWQPDGYQPVSKKAGRPRIPGEGEALRNQNRKLLARIEELEALVASGANNQALAAELSEYKARCDKLQGRVQELELAAVDKGGKA